MAIDVDGSATAPDILKNGDLRVVLHPGVHDVNGVEWFELPHIVISGDKFFGISESAASHDFQEGHPEFDLSTPASYAYNNYADIVFNSNALAGLTRIYTAAAYDLIRFVSMPRFEIIWEYGDADVSPIREAVEQGRALRIALKDEHGIWNVHPVCMPLVWFEEDRFLLDTVKSAYPDSLRNPERIAGITKGLIDFAKVHFPDYASGRNNYGAAAISNAEYWSTFYQVYADGTYKHYAKPVHEIVLSNSALRVYAEKLFQI